MAGRFVHLQLVQRDLSRRADQNEEETIKTTAVNAFRAIGLRDFGRVDMRYRDGIPYVIDINELPDLAPDAGFANSAEKAGYPYDQMVDRILSLALHREGWK
ncbi:MAG: D-alanine--D-alanine ligase [Armatimonadetes bacterium OLB18]|nr:MAG: D-alanine--D-alanine ligase [Armatimonadetes bacterium OLB18]